jgi:hypothetical protein
MISDEFLQTILGKARAARSTNDDQVFVAYVCGAGHDDFEVLATSAPVCLFMEPRICALPEVVSHLRKHYANEHADHEPWLLVVDDDAAIIMPLLPPRQEGPQTYDHG